MPRISNLERRLGLNTAIGQGRLSRVSVAIKPSILDPFLLEVPQHLDLMAARIQNGENIYSVLAGQAASFGKFADGLSRVSIRIQLGESLDSALQLFATESKSPLVSEFVHKVLLSLQRGTPLAGQLYLLADATRAQLKASQLKAAGRNELKMLVPLVFLILPVTIAFAVFPSLQLLQLGI